MGSRQGGRGAAYVAGAAARTCHRYAGGAAVGWHAAVHPAAFQQSVEGSTLFRRTRPETGPQASDRQSSASTGSSGKKGRPTPTRKEAEALAKARAKVPRTRKEMAAAQKASRTESSSNMRRAMRTGDERFLPARDQGPVKRFLRDYVDSHFSFIEMMIPLMLVVLVLGYTGNATVTTYANLAMLSVFVLIIVDLVRLRFRIRRELAVRFPTASTQGTTYYAIARSLQMRFMRLPKAQVKIGQQLPDSYR
jgi:hypothetical protein